MSQLQDWLALARSRSVVLRAAKTAVVVGAVLIAINHGDALLKSTMDAGRWARAALTVLVPYVVSTVSSVGAMLEGLKKTSSIPKASSQRR